MTQAARQHGAAGEQAAADAYIRDGYRLADRNFRTRFGEIDLVLQKEGVWVFCEVKTRAANAAVGGAEAVDERKQRKIIQAAQQYLSAQNLGDPFLRFDVAVVTHKAGVYRVSVIENAFSL